MKCEICDDEYCSGRNLCEDCYADYIEIESLTKEGHTAHCACRMVWGDGECECDKSGITRREQAEKIINIIKENG